MDNKKIKIGVVGLGHLGNYHIQQYLSISSVIIVGVFDINNDIKRRVSQKYNVLAYDSLNNLLKDSNAISITSPTTTHYEIANLALNYKCHLFIEKPITSELIHAKQLVKKAKEQNLLIQVGHIEHFNPAFLSIDKPTFNPVFIESHRLAPFNIRGTDVPVVLDLMIHDIGLVFSLTKSKIKSIKANGVKLFSNSIDLANARIEFSNGCVANLTASRISQKIMRKLRIFLRNQYVVVDFTKNTKSILSLNQGDDLSINNFSKQFIGNPLGLELESFVNCLINKTVPIIDGSFAVKALACAINIQNIINNDCNK